MRTDNLSEFAPIEYMGQPGMTQSCLEAIAKLFQFGDRVQHARLISSPDKSHAFILTINEGDIVAIKSGFGSGYLGEGAKGLAIALETLELFNVDIDEYAVDKEFIDKLNNSCLHQDDLETIEKQKPIRPARYFDYIMEQENSSRSAGGSIKKIFPASIPLRIIDDRILDLAIQFSIDPEKSITTAFNRLEDIIRQRTMLTNSGRKLISNAFLTQDAPLSWEVKDSAENVARANMFAAVFGTYRNPRSHRELKSSAEECLREFLLANELFLLEKTSE